jgi:hypothetical protein
MSSGATISVRAIQMSRDAGWVRLANNSKSTDGLISNTLMLATQLGTPARGRSPQLVEALRPTTPEEARPASLSRKFGFDSFPFHIDTAHWTVPARYLILSCVDPGESEVPTLLVLKDAVSLSEEERSVARSSVFLVKNGRRSFYSSILGLDRDFIRYDPGCMEPQTPEAIQALELFSQRRIGRFAQSIDWERGDSVIIDNWRMLHARAAVDNTCRERLLLRCLVS